LIRAALLALTLLLSSVPGRAQDARDPAYFEWETVASRAETAVEEARASNAALEQLRTEIAEWRADFQAARTTSEPRLQTLNEQLAALGPPPEAGKSEPQAVAKRRSELGQQIAALEAPRRAADEAYSRADNLIGLIDSMIRERQASELLDLGPSPLNPTNWGRALTALSSTARALANETAGVWRNPVLRADMRANLPATLLLIVAATLILFRARRWLNAGAARLVGRTSARARSVVDLIVSLAGAILPVIGVLALVNATGSLNLFGFRGEEIIRSFVLLAALISGASWVSDQIFPRSDRMGRILDLDADRRSEARFYARGLALMVWALDLVRGIATAEQYSDAARAVIQFPAAAVLGLFLLRFGALIRKGGHDIEGDEATHDFRRALLRNLGLGTMLLALLATLATAAGYHSAPVFVLRPLTETLALIGLLAMLQTFATNLYCLAFGKDEEAARDDLAPVLIGLVLALGAIPLFALIWGARQADLSEAWTKFLDGFSIGATTISPLDFLTFAVVFAVGYIGTRLVQGTLRATVLPKTRIDPGGQNAIVSGLGYIGIILSALLAITTTGLDLSSLAIVAGALSVGIGFGLQNIVSNFVAGIIMLIERPVAIGDWIEVGNHSGIVKGISVRATRIETQDKTDVIVPNAEFVAGTVTNWTRYSNLGRVIVGVKVPGGNDTRKVEAILMDIAEKHPAASGRHKPQVFLTSIEDGLRFEIRLIIKDVLQLMQVKTEIAHQVVERLATAGLVYPMQQRELFMHQMPPKEPPPEPKKPAPRRRKSPAKPAT
jgi:potassium-dependent mechanosensitive channel